MILPFMLEQTHLFPSLHMIHTYIHTHSCKLRLNTTYGTAFKQSYIKSMFLYTA